VRFISASAVHVLWLTLSAGMVAECFRVDAAEHVQFAPPALTKAGLVTLNFFAIALFLHQFFGTRLAPTMTKLRSATASPVTRRTAAAAIGIGLAGYAGFRWYRGRSHGALRRKKLLTAAQIEVPMVENVKTHVAHHREVCGRHLPEEDNQVTAASTSSVHRGWEAPILYAVANDIDRHVISKWTIARAPATPPGAKPASAPAVKVIPKRTPEREAELAEIRAKEAGELRPAIEMLQRAIALQPLSYHMHDKLVVIYGRLHEFDAIHRLLDTAVRQAQDLLQKTPKSRVAAKAIRELEKRRKNAKLREQAAAQRVRA